MSWIDCMRLRRMADGVRALGWINLGFTVVFAVIHASDGFATLAVAALWALVGFASTYGIAWLVDRRADRVVGR